MRRNAAAIVPPLLTKIGEKDPEVRAEIVTALARLTTHVRTINRFASSA